MLDARHKNFKTLIIAEAGVNHNGDINVALQLVDAAVDAGVDVIKFQTFTADRLVTKKAELANYQSKNPGQESVQNQYEMLKKLELSVDDHLKLIDYCKSNGIEFLTTAFDLESIDLLKEFPLKRHKIPSGEINNDWYLERIAEAGLPTIMSTGMASMEEVEHALETLIKNGLKKEKITVLHCNTEYPTPFEHVNIKAMVNMKKELGVQVGYSDHTVGLAVPIAAVALGAKVIEKHFTLDRYAPGPDHRTSLEPHELKAMVTAIRQVELIEGDGIKRPSPSEAKNIAVARKSIHAAMDLDKGDVVTKEMLIMKRPGIGISPNRYTELIGKRLNRNMLKDELFNLEDMED